MLVLIWELFSGAGVNDFPRKEDCCGLKQADKHVQHYEKAPLNEEKGACHSIFSGFTGAVEQQVK